LPVVFTAGLYPSVGELYASAGELRRMPDFAPFAVALARSFSTELVVAIESAPLPPLEEGRLHKPLQPLLDGGIGDHLIDVPAARQMECLSGLWLIAGDIHRSHSISQDLGSVEGSFLHGIMHRREKDFGNAKYWFRRVGSHPVFGQIKAESGGEYGDPFEFVDQCQNALRSGDPSEIDRCVQAQWIEWQSLMLSLVD
jgi:hypothetical protein